MPTFSGIGRREQESGADVRRLRPSDGRDHGAVRGDPRLRRGQQQDWGLVQRYARRREQEGGEAKQGHINVTVTLYFTTWVTAKFKVLRLTPRLAIPQYVCDSLMP